MIFSLTLKTALNSKGLRPYTVRYFAFYCPSQDSPEFKGIKTARHGRGADGLVLSRQP